MSRAENHLILIENARTMAEKTRQITLASNDAIGCEYEDLNDRLGQTLECVTALDFADGSRLVRAGDSVWADSAWSVPGAVA